ncbi:amino acid ABC transporter substrate-binding protein, PAAT family [Salinihabitans flavidus]|uniref:Amino acid ABC transporter substrate-binding protein, PAAT family n=1 Tax=Salinihabitans flavidus TaxID=569882 RepID=A0A1H8UGL7_9RHOB|nr:ABC transporter substrate-binding protein [Salinihabitans flavidus]SEP02382.1 amino acid ABC transporter substrate-binding protein, PAAT family [Salinihabitans flavidus]
MKRTIMSIVAAATFASGGAAAETLVVGAYPANPPWEYKNEQSQFEGFEVDLVTEIGDRLGVDLDFQDLGFQAIFSAISSGRIDMAISTITITDERLKNQSFTQGYYDSDLALISLKDDGVTDLEGMRDQTVGVLSSSVAEKWVNENHDDVGFESVKGYTDQQNLLLDVRSGRVAGAIGDLAGYQFAFKQMPDLDIVQTIPTGDRFGIMLPKGSPHLERVNDAISQIKEDGTLAEIHTKWLGVAPASTTSSVQVMAIPEAK